MLGGEDSCLAMLPLCPLCWGLQLQDTSPVDHMSGGFREV